MWLDSSTIRKRLIGLTCSAWIVTSLCGCVQNVFFQPDRVLYITPQQAGLSFQEVAFHSADGTQLGGWFIPATQVKGGTPAKGTVIQFHGNGQNMSSHWQLLEWLPRKGYNLFVFDYRGYGISEGTPNVEGALADSIAAIHYVRQRPDSTPDNVVIYGQSLGGTMAVAAVATGSKEGISRVIVEATFSSYSQIAHDKVPGTGWLMSDQFSAEKWIDKIAPIPLLLIHGDQDKVIQSQHSERLMTLAKAPKKIIIAPGAGHLSQGTLSTSFRLQEQILDFMEGHHEHP